MDEDRADRNGYWQACFLGLALLMVGTLADLGPSLTLGLACLGGLLGVVLFVLLPRRNQ